MGDAIPSVTRSSMSASRAVISVKSSGHDLLLREGNASGGAAVRGYAAFGLLHDAAANDTAIRSTSALMTLAALPGATSAVGQQRLKQSMTKYLDGIEYEFGVQYAPAEFKTRLHGWSLEQAFEKARVAVRDSATIDIKTFQRILMDLVQSTKDYHVSISFYSAERAKLPFTVQGVGEGAARKFFIVDIDRTRLSTEVFPFEPGSEIVKLDGRPVGAIVAELRAQAGDNIAATDQKLAEMTLTSRAAARGMDVPQGPVTITVRDAQGKEHSRQLMWDYTPETAPTPREMGGQSFGPTLKAHELQGRKSDDASAGDDELLGAQLAASAVNNMTLPMAQVIAGDERANPYGLGAKKSFLPRLGEVVAEAAKDCPFDWYICQNEQGKLVGYVRIPSYSVEDSEASLAAFADIVKEMQKSTDALVIDQVNNPGGSVFYLYTLASMLSDQPLATPRHRMSITQAEVESAKGLVKAGEAIMASKDPDTLAKLLFGPTMGGYPTSAVTAQFMAQYGRFIIEQWNEGKSVTDPSHIWAVDHINPNPDEEARYTKPILFLVNETCFSGGDFMPSIMQDNGRAKIMGVRTAGAGGYVHEIESSNLFGVKAIHVTGSIAERPTGRELENYGVTPDVAYVETERDLREGHVDQKNAINAEVSKLIAAA